MKVNTDKTIAPQPSSNLPAPEQKMNQETSSNSLTAPQNVTNIGSKQIAQQGLSVMSLQATVTRTDLQKQFEGNTRVGNGKLDQAAADRFLQGNQLANELTQKKPFDLVQDGTQNANISVRPGFNQNEQLPGLDNHSRNDQNLKSIFQDAMSSKSPSRQVDSTLIDGAKTPSHNLGEGNLLSGTDTPGFKNPTDLSNYPRQSEASDLMDDAKKAASDAWESAKKTVKEVLEHAAEKIIGPVRNNNEKEQLDQLEKQDTKQRPADDAPVRSNADPPPSTTPYNNLVDNEFTTFDSAGVDKYLRLAKGIQNAKVNPSPEGSEGSQGGPAPNEPVPGSGVVDPPDRPVQPTKGPIPVTGPIRRTPGGIPR